MIRKIIKIDEQKCNGCGLCVNACHEGAIGMENGKAVLLRDDYCDGLGDCLPVCPTEAITFETREALAYDEEAVEQNMKKNQNGQGEQNIPCGCPGTHAKAIQHNQAEHAKASDTCEEIESQLRQWPIQIKLVPVSAPYLKEAHLLVAADCTAYAYGNFHNKFMKNKITIIGCPKLDSVDYSEKLTEILKQNDIKSVTVTRMSVPCCGGIEYAVVNALKNCGKMIPWQVVTIDPDGSIIE